MARLPSWTPNLIHESIASSQCERQPFCTPVVTVMSGTRPSFTPELFLFLLKYENVLATEPSLGDVSISSSHTVLSICVSNLSSGFHLFFLI